MNPIRIDVVSDVVCPWCFIGKRHLDAAIAQAGVAAELVWHPFQLNPDMPPEGMMRSDYLAHKFGDPERIKGIHARLGAAAQDAGIEANFEGIITQPNTLAAHALVDFAQSKSAALGSATVEAIFKAHFVDNRSLADTANLVAIGESVGLLEAEIAAALADPERSKRIRDQDQNVRAQGISGVPFFIFGGQRALSGAQPVATMVEALRTVAA